MLGFLGSGRGVGDAGMVLVSAGVWFLFGLVFVGVFGVGLGLLEGALWVGLVICGVGLRI